MRLANENGLKVSIAGTSATVALILIVRLIAGSDVPTVTSVSHGEGRKNKFAIQKESNLSLLRSDRLKISEGIGYAGKGRNIFRLEIPIPSPPQPKPSPPAPEKQFLPTKAKLRLKFFGFAITSGGGKQVFLSEDGDVFIGKEGDIVNRRYRILQVKATSVEIEDLVDEVQQMLPLEQG